MNPPLKCCGQWHDPRIICPTTGIDPFPPEYYEQLKKLISP
jgi:hypothetical protein